MVYIEPIRLQIKTPGEQLSPTIEESYTQVSDWSDTYNWTLNKLIDDDYNTIDGNMLFESIQESIGTVLEPIQAVDERIAERFQRKLTHPWRRNDLEEMAIYKDNIVLLPSSTEGHLFIVSEYKNDVDSIIDSFEGRINSFSDVAADFGLSIDLLHGKEFAESMAKSLNAEIVDREEFDNNTEESVYDEISERLTKSVDTNVTLRFGDDDPEVFEYDLLLFAGRNSRIIIEVKDASRDEASLDKGELIDTPRDKTNILKSDREKGPAPFYTETTEVFVIVKHMDEEQFEEQKQMAERRDINLLKYEDGNYLDSLEDRFRTMTQREL